MNRMLLIPAVIAATSMSCAAWAEPVEGQWRTTLSGGATFAPSVLMVPGIHAALVDLGVVDPMYAGDSATTTANRLSFRDAFRTGPIAGLEMSYGVSSRLEPFMRFDYQQFGGRDLAIGDVASAALATPAAISANFDDLRSSSLVIGARYFFLDTARLRPFVSGFLGANHTDGLRADLAAPALSVNLGRETILPAATRFTAGLQAGVGYAVNDQMDLRFSMGANYIASQKYLANALNALGISALDVNDRRWSLPAEFGISYRF